MKRAAVLLLAVLAAKLSWALALVVALLFDKSVHSHIAMLAVLKLHAAYVPLDPGFPDDRCAFICEDAGVRRVRQADENGIARGLGVSGGLVERGNLVAERAGLGLLGLGLGRQSVGEGGLLQISHAAVSIPWKVRIGRTGAARISARFNLSDVTAVTAFGERSDNILAAEFDNRNGKSTVYHLIYSNVSWLLSCARLNWRQGNR